ncbi:uncharacterized protein K460DRAFT_119179 [Cucurbitaria berberidis CBS 394.84]|uniref:Uncharacterized protein n=1 Tax=Cucurbitaria berberidis CBS 394.84 TaxID=1168544 RepID=A0A9P4GI17_9PLEO|nr:uncharacterized protein K460DRAFT_119179 [Cucurbitaria berberidis CBS 394.84]KAF1846032.1 hypothetical protein K460DRAFT_119179 [Cucurbitaria berberidis CBS 394.84]
MASSSKKRRSSKSPSRDAASKRVRPTSTTASTHSHQTGSEPKLARAKSVFRGDQDPYFPNKHERATSLPTGDDWAFRVKVISSSTDLNDDVFKKAVQGLVKICFPQGVLEELGIDVVYQHMQEENASEENIARMKDIFRSEMMHRITWMLAEYMDSPARVEAGVQSMIAASAKLHGDKLGNDVLGDIITSLHRLREHVPDDSTGRLANIDVLQAVPSGDETDNMNNIQNSSDEASEEHVPVPKKKNKKRDKNKSRKVPRKPPSEENELDMNIDEPTSRAEHVSQPSTQSLHENRDNKISSKWFWDVNPNGLAAKDVSEHFKKTSDLFAFHALPIAKKKVGPNAKRKAIRYEMESMLADMQDTEYDKWVESHQKLLDGDREMLVRPEPDATFNNRGRSAATPAPIDARRRVENNIQAMGSNSSQGAGYEDRVSMLPQHSTLIKREINADLSAPAGNHQAKAQTDEVAAATTAFRHLSTEERNFRPPVTSIETTGRDDGEDLQVPRMESPTPIVDLLYGDAQIERNDRLGAVQLLMARLCQRVIVDSITIAQYDGTFKLMTSSSLQKELTTCFVSSRGGYSPQRLRIKLEENLIPWICTNAQLFPELRHQAFFFTHIKPTDLVVINKFCDRSLALDKESRPIFKASVTMILHKKGLSPSIKCGRKNQPFQDYLHGIVPNNEPDKLKRHRMDKVLRHLVFVHWDKFPEFRDTRLVKEWEHLTGLKW